MSLVSPTHPSTFGENVERGLLVAFTNAADPALRDEFNDWYFREHVPDNLGTHGVVDSRRFARQAALVQSADGGVEPWSPNPPWFYDYVAIYNLETEDLGLVIADMKARYKAGKLPEPGLMQMSPIPLTLIYRNSANSSERLRTPAGAVALTISSADNALEPLELARGGRIVGSFELASGQWDKRLVAPLARLTIIEPALESQAADGAGPRPWGSLPLDLSRASTVADILYREIRPADAT
jgi:hypothetical protein